MFTGIVRDVGTIQSSRPAPGEGREIMVQYDLDAFGVHPAPGDSVAVNGVCLTVTDRSRDRFSADVSEETLACTTLGDASEGDEVNLEPSLRAGDQIGGHFVFGHVDDMVPVVSLKPRGDYHDLTVRFPEKFRPFLARKGSVALDGISLTVNEVTEEQCTVRIVPHTLEKTTFGGRSAGDDLNLEVDMLARYVHNHLKSTDGSSGAVTVEDLAEAGFLQS